jgi:hypothetical protein
MEQTVQALLTSGEIQLYYKEFPLIQQWTTKYGESRFGCQVSNIFTKFVPKFNPNLDVETKQSECARHEDSKMQLKILHEVAMNSDGPDAVVFKLH